MSQRIRTNKQRGLASIISSSSTSLVKPTKFCSIREPHHGNERGETGPQGQLRPPRLRLLGHHDVEVEHELGRRLQECVEETQHAHVALLAVEALVVDPQVRRHRLQAQRDHNQVSEEEEARIWGGLGRKLSTCL